MPIDLEGNYVFYLNPDLLMEAVNEIIDDCIEGVLNFDIDKDPERLELTHKKLDNALKLLAEQGNK